MGDVVVEVATAADVEALVELNRGVQDLHVAGEPAEFLPFDGGTEPGVRDELAALVAAKDHLVLVARSDGDPVGYLVAQRVERPASPYCPAVTFHYVHQIGVRPSSRGAGIGRALLDTVEDEARACGSTRVSLDHWSFNERAARFFAGRGYEPYNVRRRKRLDAAPTTHDEGRPGLRAPTTLTTPRLRLRPPTMADARAVHAYASDPRVTRYLTFPTHRSLDDAVVFLRRVEQGWTTATEFTWALEFGADVVGTCAVRDTAHGVEFGYVLAYAYWGRGLMTEAASAIVAWARTQPTVHRVWAYRDVDNTASGRVLQRAGLPVEATLRRYVVMGNLSPDPRDAVVHAWARP